MLSKVIKKSFKIAWSNPLFWVFGFFVSYLTINEIILVSSIPWQITQGIPVSSSILRNLSSISNLEIKEILRLIASLLVSFLIPFFLAVFSQIVLFQNTANKLKKKPFTLKKTFSKFWPVFLLNLIVILINSIVLQLTISLSYNLSDFVFWLILFLMLVIELLLFLIIKLIICSLLLKESDVILATKKGILLFKKFFWQTLSLVFILFLLNLAFTIIIDLAAIGGFSPFSILSSLMSQWGAIKGGEILFYSGLIIIGILALILWTIFFTFQTIVWPIFFLEISKD